MFLDFVGARGQELCQRRHLSWVARPNEIIAIDTTMPDVLPVTTRQIYAATEYWWFWPSDFWTPHVAWFAVVGLSLGHWPLSSLPKMFPCCCKERLMTHVYGVVSYMEVRRGHWKEKMNWYCIGQKWEWF